MGYLYHGSETSNIKVLEPHKSTHGNYVYATKDKNIAIIMSKCCGDDTTYSLRKNNNDGVLDLVERIPGAFNKMFKNSFSLYTLSDETFKDTNTGFDEVVSETGVSVIKEEHYNSLINVINELVANNKIRIYYYPDRPDYIPKDDYDLLYKIKHTYIEKFGKKYNDRELSRWIFLHPNLEEELRIIAREQNVIVPSYEEIKANYIETQKNRPDHEMYIDNALELYEMIKAEDIKKR
jgi:hypothetical protein